MIRKIIVLIFVFPALHCGAQVEFNHSLGGSILFLSKTAYINLHPCVQYDFGLSYVFDSEFSLSLTASPAVDPFGITGDRMASVPLYLQINAGHGASKYSYSETGCFAGAGALFFGPYDNGHFFRPAFTFGVRNLKHNGRSLTLKCDFAPHILGKTKASHLFNIGILYNFSFSDSWMD